MEVWQSPILAGPLVGPPVVADLNGDGQKDVAVTSEQNVLYIGFATPESPRWVKVELGTDVRSVPAAAALGGNADLTLLLGTETGRLLFINGKQARLNGSLNVTEELSKATGRFEQNNPLRAPVAVGDLNGDAREDLVVTTVTGKLITFDGLTLERLWYASSSGTSRAQSAAPVLADLDSDGLLDVVWHAPDGNLMAFKGTGQGKDRSMLLWQQQVQGGTNPVVADFDKDGTWDVAVAGSDGTISVFAGATGERLWRGKGGNPSAGSVLLLGDLNADRRLDLLLPETDGKFTRLATNSTISKAAIVWGQAYGNSEHTGRSRFQPEDLSAYHGYIGASLLLIVMTAGLQFFIRRKRSKLV
ncbi:MAG: VCBS repeat-containing protein [Calditrichaeota bacterium]|nr:MAG: VCBS repeat-containing protein [Calditrichota bacterium]